MNEVELKKLLTIGVNQIENIEKKILWMMIMKDHPCGLMTY